MQQKIIILDFGSQTTQLIGRRVRELDTFCEIMPYNKFPKDDPSVIGVILSGSPYSVHDPEAFKVDLSQFIGRIPVLGICYGAQFLSYAQGGKVEAADSREYGRANLEHFDKENPLFKGFIENSQVWMSHGDTITAIPDDYKCIASTANVKYAAYASTKQPVWAVQFHPEVFHSLQGTQLLKNFVVDICGSKQDWSADSFVETTVAELKAQLGDDKVILGLSGGVDSSVAAVLLNKAIGKNLTCIFVDHGMLRKNEFRDVMEDYKCLGLNVIGVDASEKFFADLAGVTDPEKKRKIIGRDFVEVFNAEAKKQEPVKVNSPGSVSEIKVPEKSVLNILVDKTGKIFMSLDNQNDVVDVLSGMTGQYGISLTKAQVKKFQNDPMWGAPMDKLEAYLSLSTQDMSEQLPGLGIPTDSIDGKESEFQLWVRQARDVNPDIKIAIKADEATPYSIVKKIMSELQDMNENRYYLITTLAKED